MLQTLSDIELSTAVWDYSSFDYFGLKGSAVILGGHWTAKVRSAEAVVHCATEDL